MAQKVYQLITTGDRVTFFRKMKDGRKVPVASTVSDYKVPLKYTFTDEAGESKTIRFLKASNTPYQDEQIKAGFLANIKLTSSDRNELLFKNGFLVTAKANVQKYLDIAPCNEAFKGDRDNVPVLFREYKPKDDKKKNFNHAMRQAEAVTKMRDFEESEIDEMLVGIFGSHVTIPKDMEDKQELMLFAINEHDHALDIILKKKEADKTAVLIGLAINAGVLSFQNDPKYVQLKAKDKWENIKNLSEEHNEEQKLSLFKDFIDSSDGKALKSSIETALKAVKKAKEKELENDKKE